MGNYGGKECGVEVRGVIGGDGWERRNRREGEGRGLGCVGIRKGYYTFPVKLIQY